WAYLSTHPSKHLNSFCYDDDDDEDYTLAITPDEPVLSPKEPDNSLKFSLIDDDSFSIDNIDYVEASPLDSELFSSEVMEIVIPEVGGIDDDILLTIKDDVLHKKLLNVNLLISKIEALNVNPTPSSDCKTNSGSTTTHSDISLPEYEAFYDDHVKEISSGSPTTHSDSSLYASFIFDLSINPFPLPIGVIFMSSPMNSFPSYRHQSVIVSSLKLNQTRGISPRMWWRIFLQQKNHKFRMLYPPTHPTLQLNMKFQPSSEYLFTYVVWIFLHFLVYSVSPHYLLSLRSEDTIFDPDICNSRFSRPDVSHRCGTFLRFKILSESPMEIFSSTCSHMDK
nr:hypothetical protein [Tanacetum cinerariifolium]